MAKKENNQKNHSAREKWMEQKRQGRPKQRWVPSTLFGQPFPEFMTLDEIEREINGHSIESYVPAHWEKVAAATA
jgi:hypothetical protein